MLYVILFILTDLDIYWDIIDISKLGRYSEIKKTNSRTPNTTLDFTKPELVDCTEFDVIIVAEQINKGKLTILSPVYNSRGESSDDEGDNPNKGDGNNNTGLIIIIVVLSAVIIGGGIAAFFIIRKYKSKGMISTDGKATSMALLKSTASDKLVESQAVVDP